MKHPKLAFPSLLHESRLTYLDAAAMTPLHIDTEQAIREQWRTPRTNVHRSVHPLGELTDARYQEARQKMASLLDTTVESICWTEKTTLGLYKTMQALTHIHLTQPHLLHSKAHTIWVSASEHHSNYLPWQHLAKTLGFSLQQIPFHPLTGIDFDWVERECETQPPFLIAVNHASNVSGIITDLIRLRTLVGEDTLLIVDGAQAVSHLTISLASLHVDAYAFSGYKVGGMTGTGVLFLSERLRTLPCPVSGGGMLLHASHDFFTPQPFPVGWEAGTPHIDGIHSLPIAYSSWHEAWRMNPDKEGMTRTLIAGLNALPVSLIGAPDAARIGLVSFMSPLWHAHDLGTLLAERGIFVRVGQHCAQPLFESLQCAGSVRVSFGPYNTIDDVHILLSTLKEIL